MRTFHKINNLKVVRTRPTDNIHVIGQSWVVMSPERDILARFQREDAAVRHTRANMSYIGGEGPIEVLMSSNMQENDIKTFVKTSRMASRLARWFVNQLCKETCTLRVARVSDRKSKKLFYKIERWGGQCHAVIVYPNGKQVKKNHTRKLGKR